MWRYGSAFTGRLQLAIDLELSVPRESAFSRDPEIKSKCIWQGTTIGQGEASISGFRLRRRSFISNSNASISTGFMKMRSANEVASAT